MQNNYFFLFLYHTNMSARKTHNRNDSSFAIGEHLADALRRMGKTGRSSYITRTLNPSVSDLKETLITKEKERKKIEEKIESKWEPFFSKVKTVKDFNELIEARENDVKRHTEDIDKEIQYIQKIIKGKGEVLAKSDKIDQETPTIKKAKSFFSLNKTSGSSSKPASKPSVKSKSIGNLFGSAVSSSKPVSKTSGIGKILKSTPDIKNTRLMSPTNRSRFAN
jgi:hypothetical protein